MSERQITIIGGTSFVGQHIIRQLQKRGKNITRICVLVYQCFKQNLEYEMNIPTEVVTGSVTSLEDVLFATQRSDTVLHLAVTRDKRMFIDSEPLEAVNILGTNNVIKACKLNRVKNLIYLSFIDVVIGEDDIFLGTELNTAYPKKHLFPDAITGFMAEKAVINAHEWSVLHTLVLRPVTMYGELDNRFLPGMLRIALMNDGTIIRVGDQFSQIQIAYLGNVAWAVVCAEETLCETPEVCGGQVYFVADDTPPDNIFNIIKPVLRRYGFFVTRWSVPERYAKMVVQVLKVVSWFLSPFIGWNPKVSYELLHFFCRTYTFSDARARRDFGYQPLYSPSIAWLRTLSYMDEKFKVAVVDFLSKNVMGKTGHTATMLKMNSLRRNITTKGVRSTRKYSVQPVPQPGTSQNPIVAFLAQRFWPEQPETN